jgi:chaperone modulatory protein CbpM
MDKNEQLQASVELIDEQTIFTLADLCRSCSVKVEFIEAMVEEGILEPTGERGHHWCFQPSSLRRTRITLHLQQDLGVNLAGAALALDLLEHIDKVESQLRRIRTGHGRSVDVSERGPHL